jgi:hypothetical protein
MLPAHDESRVSSVKPTLPGTNTTEQPPPTLFRFSLLTLLSVMTLAGFVSAIVFSKHWDTDERLLLAFWCAGLILGVSIGRFCGNSGVISGGLGAVVGCTLATCLLLEKSYARQQLTAWDGQPITPYLAFIVVVGWFAAMFAALAYRAVATGWFERMWFNQRVRRVLLGVVGSLFCVLIVAQLWQERRWQPAWEVDLRTGKWDDTPVFQISPQGNFLFSHLDRGDYLTRQTDSLFQFTGRGVVRRDLSGAVDQPNLALSPDGNWLAAGTSCYVSLFDLATGKDASVWKLNDIEMITQMQFNAAGELLVISQTPRIQRCYVFDIACDPLPPPQLFPFAGRLLLDPTGDVLIKLYEGADENTGGSVEVVRRRDSELLGKLPDFPPIVPSHIAAGGRYLGSSNRVWQLEGTPLELAGQVIGFTADERAIVLDSQDANAPPVWLPAWLHEMPFVRHLHDDQSMVELQLVDLKTGKTVAKTARLAGLTKAQASQAGNAVVGISLPGSHFRVWKVPPRK